MLLETDEVIKIVDGIYKGIQDHFNPAAKHLILAGKTYLKALHSATAASKAYDEALKKIAIEAQKCTWGAASDIASSLLQVRQKHIIIITFCLRKLRFLLQAHKISTIFSLIKFTPIIGINRDLCVLHIYTLIIFYLG